MIIVFLGTNTYIQHAKHESLLRLQCKIFDLFLLRVGCILFLCGTKKHSEVQPKIL